MFNLWFFFFPMWFFTHHCITILPVKVHPILFFILCLPLKGRIGSEKKGSDSKKVTSIVT
jgi:hypothetical protein